VHDALERPGFLARYTCSSLTSSTRIE
jgi:hypothetical protein